MAFYSILYEKGKREKNEDTVAIHKFTTIDGEVIMALVCDGCGGMDMGECASGYMTECIEDWFYSDLPDKVRRGTGRRGMARDLKNLIFRAHEEIRRYGAGLGKQLGTTLTLFISVNSRYLILQSGDSAAYSISKRSGCLTAKHAKGGRLTRCIGSGKYNAPSLTLGKIRAGSAFLLVSDGMCHTLEGRDYSGALMPQKIKDADAASRGLRTLADAAMRRGETDNISAVYLHF
ncbi:MAG: protein phosphatase 2C domain-containing protein [Lachnospiraceae bacterium]|nr:protein phosphatase 2C domain-containing protein [Lachnospiraceae bacterium]